MRLTTIRTGGTTHAARVEGDNLIVLGAPDVGTLLASGSDALATAPATGQTLAFEEADLAPIVTSPGKVVCLGHNYEQHIREMGRDLPAHPTLFAKYSDALIGAHDPIVIPPESDKVDWEAELALVIGTPARRADPRTARAAIAGYTVCNDISMRDWQKRTLQWLQGKTWERSTPLGPMLVTPEEIDHATDLEIGCEVDGEQRQRARTCDLLFDPVAIVQYVSTICTLRPGDVICSGTPGGVGDAMDPPQYLRAGQQVRTWIEGIGELSNVCVDEETGEENE